MKVLIVLLTAQWMLHALDVLRYFEAFSYSLTINFLHFEQEERINTLNPELNPICYLLALLLTIFSTLAG